MGIRDWQSVWLIDGKYVVIIFIAYLNYCYILYDLSSCNVDTVTLPVAVVYHGSLLFCV